MAAAASSLDRNYKYDVFLSFRGPDTRKNFVGHLYRALERKLLTAFIDNEDLAKGENIQVLLKAIEDSKLSVVVFSENYAFSRWCLKELAQIVECMDTMKHIVVPIFFQVDPADVRYQKKKFVDAFAEHEHKGRETSEVLKSWRSALNRVADLSGWDSRDFKDDAQLIEQVVEDVFQKLIKIRSSKSESCGLVAMEYHMKQMELLLRGNNCIVGIWGMGGLGKTTIARAVYGKFICNFDACCFLENVRHEFRTKGGPQLQEVLLYKLLKEKVRNLGTTDMNSEMINGMLTKKKLFIVLDDVDNIAQVAALLGDSYHLFTGESRIIITTRDVSLLSGFPIYNPMPLGSVKALELFRKHADNPSEQYDSLLGRAIEYTKGLPLAIKVLGASLRGKSTSVWKDELKKIRIFQYEGIEGVLRTSFDGLDVPQQTIFLDVACFFIGNNKEYVTTVLDACKLFPESGLRVLVDRALITISPCLGVLGMHDLLQDMAWGIVRLTKSRLIPPMNDILETLIENEATAAVESIYLDLHNLKDVDINLEAFVNMKKLRLLKIHYGSSEELYHLSDEYTQTVSGDLQSLSRELRCLIWHGCPLKSLPSKFHPKHLVDIDMRCSSIIQLWEGIQPLGKLKYIDLSRCLYLEKIPDLSKATNLEKVNLEGCIRLSEVHSSISDLKHLAFLNLKGCRQLETLPSSISMTSLETLELSGCPNLKIFPEISEVIKDVKQLCLDMTAIKELHSSIINLKGLVTLSLIDCRELETLPSSICQLKSLRYVTLSGCSKFKVFPEIVGPEDMSHLIELHLDGTSIKEFLHSPSALKRLRVLSLRDCKELKTLPSTIRMDYLESLFLSGCSNLQKFPHISGFMFNLSELHLDEIAIEELPPSISNLYCLISLIVRDCGEIRSLPSSIFRLRYLKEITLSGCSKFEEFPEFVEKHCRDKRSLWFSSLVTLRLEDCGELKSLPSSIFLLESLRFVSLSGCSKFEVFPEIYEYRHRRHVRELHLDGTSIKDLPPSIERLKSITLLNMSNCRSLVFLPDNICNLSDLTGLTLTGCSNLHNLPKNLEKLEFLLDLDIEGSGINQPLSPLRLMRSPSSATDCLVGMDGHIERMEMLLCLGEAKDVLTVGIWGMCGIGKTTLASVVYNKIAPQFEHCCFLESVNEGINKHGAVYMQENLLSTVLKEKVRCSGILNGDSDVMMDRLRMKKVLLVLDDINDITQIEILLGKPYAVGDGSRIIITTRREKLDGISGNYCPKLSDGEALELFRKFTFGTIRPSDEYDQLSQRAIACAQGLPLALKVLGYLSRISIHRYWDGTLKKIESNGLKKVFSESISALHDPEKTIFLDVACFLKGREKDYVTEILRSCGFFPYSGLRSLIDRCLLTISHWDKTVQMYDSIHEVGREWVRLESQSPGQRSRLWTDDGIQCLSSDYEATSKVEAINIDLSNSKEIHFKAKAFVAMKKLRLLRILDEGSTGRKQTVSENFDFLSHELRCLIWHRCPLRSLPSNFHPWNLVELDMRGSLIEKLRGETKFLRNLKFINLSHCPYLKKIPDLSEATNLKKLVLDGCTSLIEVHPSIWDHKDLVLLSLKDCRELEIVLDSIHMISLKTLNLSGCSKFEKFPDDLEVMMELAELGLDETAIKELPSSIQHLQGLNVLSLGNCTSLVSLPDSICRLEHLRFLNLYGCSKLSGFPDSLRNKQSLITSGIELFPLLMRSKETEGEGVIGVSGQGSSSESGQGRKLPAVEEAQSKRERVTKRKR